MIHRLSILDRDKSIGITIYEDDILHVQSELLTSLVQALMMLGEEMGPVKGALREAELGKYQISILSRDHLAYIAVHDAYDSEPFTNKILEAIIEKFHPILILANFNTELPNNEQIREEVSKMLSTMKFPPDKLDEVTRAINGFQISTNSMADALFLSDLDDGIVEIFFNHHDDETIIRLLMEILSEIPFERHWVGQSKLRVPYKIGEQQYLNELWLIYRIGLTDFCLMGRAYYNTMDEYDKLLMALDELIEELSFIVQD